MIFWVNGHRSTLRPRSSYEENRLHFRLLHGTTYLTILACSIYAILSLNSSQSSSRSPLFLVRLLCALLRQAVASFGKFLPHLSVGVEKGQETAHAGLDVVSGLH